LFTLAIFLASIWSLSIYTSRTLHGDIQRVLGEQQSSATSFIAAGINYELNDRLDILRKIAAGTNQFPAANAITMQKLLTQHPALQNHFNEGVIALRLDGTVIAEIPSAAMRIGSNWMGVGSVASALKEGKSTIGQPFIDQKLLAPAFVIAVPIRDNRGKLIGALGGVTNLDKHGFLGMITENRYGKSGYYLLEDPGSRLIITGSDKSLIMQPISRSDINWLADRQVQGHNETGITVNSFGVEVLASASSIPVANWLVVTALPTAEAFAPIHAMQQRMLLATLFLTLLAGGLTWWMLRRQLSPMLAAIETLATLSETNRPLQPLPISSQDEIGKLLGSFNQMQKTLAKQEEVLKESEKRYRTLVEWSPEAVIVLRTGRLIYVNPAAIELFGASSAQELTGTPILDLVHPDFQQVLLPRLHNCSSDGGVAPMLIEKFIRLDGTIIDVEAQYTSIVYDGESVIHGSIRDITERKQAEEKLQLAASVFTHAREAILITTPDATIIDVNQTFTQITGYARNEVLGCNPKILNSGHQGKEFYADMWQSLIAKGYWYGEVWNRRKNGEVYAEMLTIGAVRDDQGNTQQYVALFSDITVLKEHESQLEHIAHYDALTTLPNRVLLADRLHQAMAQVQRGEQRLAVAYLDLDGFKSINDNHGHEAGDQLLMIVASRMKEALREGDTLARLGGDEFVAVLFDLADIETSVPVLARLLAAAAKPVHVGKDIFQVSASIGVTFYPQTEIMDADQLLRQADQAMYQAKLAGKNRYHVFDAEHDRSVRIHHESLEHIRLALSGREFVLHYQPKVNMRTGTVIGAEALVRWQHPEKGLLAPALFLPAIENHPLAIELGEWVIDTAMTQMEIWHAKGLDIPVSVNIGACQLLQADFVDRLRALLASHPEIMPCCIELEVLETSALEDLVRSSQVIESCRKIGVMFALDDFGTGYSSLTYLKHLPVGQLKIDQSFVRGMLDAPDDLAILESVLGLGTAFRRKVIAEGVETVEHGVMLLQLGCELAQGYGIASPMPADEFPGWAANWRPHQSWINASAVSRDDISVLYAGVEHRAWILAIEAFLKGEREAPPAIDHHQCRFGTWLESDGLTRYSSHPAFHCIVSLHQQVHMLAAELLEFRAKQQNHELQAKLDELHGLRDTLLEQLKILVQENN